MLSCDRGRGLVPGTGQRADRISPLTQETSGPLSRNPYRPAMQEPEFVSEPIHEMSRRSFLPTARQIGAFRPEFTCSLQGRLKGSPPRDGFLK